MDQRRRYAQGGVGHPYQNGPRQQDAADSMYGQFGPPRGQGRPHASGTFRNGERIQSPGADSRTSQNGPLKEKEQTLTENRIFPLERPSPMFPNAKWFCRLCHQHFNQMVTALDHCSIRIHARKKAALDLRKVVLAMPRTPEQSHRIALEKELMNVYNAQKMTEKNLERREEVVSEISMYLQENLAKSDLKVDPKYLEFKLHLQGSTLSKLGLSSSDINMDLHLCQAGPADVQAKIYFEVLRILDQWPVLTNFDAQLNLTIPMVKAVHEPSSFSIEILFGGVAPLKTNRLLQDYGRLDERFAPLAVNFRYWAKQCSLDDPQKGFLPAHSFAIMTVFYLQQVSPPVLPCIHDSMKDPDDDDYKGPEEQKDWKSENEASVAELWLGMLRFYAAEFPVKKLCVSIRSRKKSFLAQRRWPPRFIGIEDPYCSKKSLAKCIVSDLVMPYLLMCLRASYIYFAVPRFSEKQPLFDFLNQLKLEDVEDPEGDDIEDGLAADEEIQENEDDQDQDEEQDAATGGDAVEVEVMLDLRGWNQSWQEDIREKIRECDALQYCMDNVGALTGKTTAPVVCILCRQPGHRANACPDAKLPEAMPVESHAFLDSQGVHSELCQYIYENFRPTISERELSARVRIVQEIESFIQRTMPEAYLTLFGSSRNGFSLEKADLDICLKYKNKEGIDESMDVKDIIVGISRILEEHHDISDVQAIASAKVPIVKFHHDPFGVDGDISLYNVLAEHNTAMLKVYSLIDERVVHLGAAFKQYVKLCDMGDASRGSLSSYAYIVMLIHYLQKENVVPVLQALPPVGHPPGEELPKVMIDGWNAYYFEDVDRLEEVWPLLGTNKKTVGQLWLGLIDYYATKFRFDHHVVCIRQLEPLSRLEKMWTNKPLCIEDPFELDHNLGTGISGKMAKYIFSALITSRNWFLRTPERAFSSPAAIYKHFMNLRELAVGKPPKDRGCKRCGKIGHWIKACPVKQGEATDKKSNRRVCHACGKPGHIVKECPTRLKQIRTPKDRPHQQQQDNRFPVNSFSSTDQTRPTISQNDMTSPSAHSSAARGEGTSAVAPEVKTVSGELGSDRKKPNRKSSTKKLAQKQPLEESQTCPSEEVIADAPSVRKKIVDGENPRREEEQGCLPQQLSQHQQRKKAKRSKRRKNQSNAPVNQSQSEETTLAAPETRTEVEISDACLPEPELSSESNQRESIGHSIEVVEEVPEPNRNATETDPVTSRETTEAPEPFKFEFVVQDDIEDDRTTQEPTDCAHGGVVAEPKKQEKGRRKAKRAQITQPVRRDLQRDAQEPNGSPKDGPEPSVPPNSSTEARTGFLGECDARACGSDRGKAESDAGEPEKVKTEGNTAQVLESPQDEDLAPLPASNPLGDPSGTVEEDYTAAIHPPLQANAEKAESSQLKQDTQNSSRDQNHVETSEEGTVASLLVECGGVQRKSKYRKKKIRDANKSLKGKPLGGDARAQSPEATQSQSNHAFDSSHANETSGTIEPSTVGEEGEVVRGERDAEEPLEASKSSQSSRAGLVEDSGLSCDKTKSEVEPLDGAEPESPAPQEQRTFQGNSPAEIEKPLQQSSQIKEEETCENRVGESSRPGKSKRAKKKAQSKALRNARKKLERAMTSNPESGENEATVSPTQSVKSENGANSSSNPGKLNDPVRARESQDPLLAEQVLAPEDDTTERKEPRRKKARASKKKPVQ